MKLRQKIELTLALALISACGAMTGCAGGMTPAQTAQYNRIKCEAQALAPLALYDADFAVKEIESGGLSLEQILAVGPTVQKNAGDVKAAFKACRAEFPKPAADAGAQ